MIGSLDGKEVDGENGEVEDMRKPWEEPGAGRGCVCLETVLLHWVLAWCWERKHLEFGALALLQIE